jgi:magnesium-transporting ATPase (P-type)
LYLRATTACMTAIVITQMANVFACRSETRPFALRDILANRLLLGGVMIELLMAVGFVYAAWGQRVFGTAPIGWSAWAIALPFAAALLLVDALWKHRASSVRAAVATADRTGRFSGLGARRIGRAHF